jgi:uncharacterized membrane protein YhhN
VTPLVTGLLSVAALAAVLDWVAAWRGGAAGRALERAAKPVVPAALALAAVAWPAQAASTTDLARPWLVAGLVASLAGDVLLLPPGRFVPGLAAFLVAHLAYLGGFLLLPGEVGWLAAGAVAGIAVAATLGRVLVRAASRVGLGGPVALYLAAITLMAVAATRTGEPAAIAGAWLFVGSDAMLGWGRLRAPRPGMPRGGRRGLGTAVLVSYHLAQGLILVALAA